MENAMKKTYSGRYETNLDGVNVTLIRCGWGDWRAYRTADGALLADGCESRKAALAYVVEFEGHKHVSRRDGR